MIKWDSKTSKIGLKGFRFKGFCLNSKLNPKVGFDFLGNQIRSEPKWFRSVDFGSDQGGFNFKQQQQQQQHKIQEQQQLQQQQNHHHQQQQQQQNSQL